MKALFYDQAGSLVWECKKDARFELNNGSKAIRKGAKLGILYDAKGAELDRARYNVTH